MIHTLRVAKTTITLIASLTLLAIIAGLIYLNQVGFPGQYGNWLRDELANRGLHLSFDSVRFDLRRGLVAKNVSFYVSEESRTPLLEAGEMTIDLDKTKALRGIFKLRNIHLSGGTARIPVDENGRMVTARHIDGALIITETGRATVQEATGLIKGIRVTVSADLKLTRDIGEDLPEDQQKALQSNHVLSLVLDELALWTIPPETPPHLSFEIKGDLNNPERLSTEFKLQASDLTRNDYHLNRLNLSGDLQAQLVTLDEILLEDDSGIANGQADWSVSRREGRFDVNSALQLQDFLQSCFGITVLKGLTLDTPPVLQLSGTYAAPENKRFSVHASGHGNIGAFSFSDTPFTGLTSDFSWQDGDLYLRDLEVTHRKGQMNGSILLENGLARYDMRSTLPMSAFSPFVKKGSTLDKIRKDLTFSENSIFVLDAVGTSDRTNLTSWTAVGKAHFTNFSFRGTKFQHLASDYNFIPGQTEFSKTIAQIDDNQEKARTRFGAARSGEFYSDRVLYDTASRVTTVSNLRGTIFPTPVIRIFTPAIANYIEKEYRFHQPPHIALNGTFSGRKEDQSSNLFSVAVRTEGQTDYPFLGKDLPLQNLTADIVVRGTGITVKNLSCNTLGGAISGSVFADVTPGKKTSYKGGMKWDNLSFPLISKTYEFDEEEKGTLTGSLDFKGNADGIRSFNATGLIGITKGNLVSLPILGPLSPIIAGVLGDKRAGYERAKECSSTFSIIDGVAQTKDFVATSTSIVLTGEGWVDLATDRMDMTVRVNARGLLGLLTMPLKPLKGIFQFRGTGDYSEPKWRSSPFTRPRKGKADPLFQRAGKAQIVPQ